MSGRESATASMQASEPVPCAHCGAEVDPLRAARVRIVAERFCYFCSSACADDFAVESFELSWEERGREERARDDRARDDRISEPRTETRGTLEQTSNDTPERITPLRVVPAPAESLAPRAGRDSVPSVVPASVAATSEGDLTLLHAAVAGSALSVVLLLAVDTRGTLYARVGITLLAAGALIAYAWRQFQRGNQRYALPSAVLVGVGWVCAFLALLVNPAIAGAFSSFIGTLVAFASISLLLIERYDVPSRHERAQIAERLSQTALRISGEHTERISITELRPGEEIVIHAGETVVADATVVVGRGEIYPWLGATGLRSVQPGDFIYAGAKLRSGQLRATVRWSGSDRHWQRLLGDPARRADVHAPPVVFARKVAVRGSLAVGLIVAGVGLAQGLHPSVLALNVLAALSVLLNPAIVRLCATRAAEAVLEALRHGIVVRSASVLDAAGRVSTAVFCARGTLLLGEPEVSSVEALGKMSEDEVLSLVAGAEQVGDHPIAVAILRAARARGVTPDAVRSPRAESGLGVTALASNGKALVVGSRALMLRERISVARAEARITELEAMGRTVLLIAVAQHLVGILAFQDGLRTGARAAVQHLLDVGIEPVLLSGDGRESCEALGRAIDIDHIRPEVLPNERGHEVERLRNSGAVVAVVGRSPADDVALGAASISVALPSTGTQAGAFDIELAGDEVQKAAVALRLVHRFRVDALRTLVIVVGGGAACALGTMAVSAPPALVPAGGAIVTWIATVLLSNSRSQGSGIVS